MEKKLINLAGLTGVISLISYAVAVIFAPLAYPGYNWMTQAVSDLSTETAPSRLLWDQLSAAYNVCSPVCMMCVAIFVSDKKISTKLFRLGIYLFAIMNWISAIGYKMFPLTDSGKEISTFQEKMHIVITIVVVLLSISSLTILIIAGFKKNGMKGIGIWASIALAMMFVGAIGKSAVSPDYFGIVERFSVFAAVGFNAVLGVYLLKGYQFVISEQF
ncbi:DUF998 domain-containing protein [Butyrivibrio sp.]|uniref:DUF998 domain-containing protein n=1 Tax=Butyrivibrio sp. TaxID=28121 RepID=UPI0025BF19D6|nr:DUF998 domain-containing protein [Butyrivibrio sp.]